MYNEKAHVLLVADYFNLVRPIPKCILGYYYWGSYGQKCSNFALSSLKDTNMLVPKHIAVQYTFLPKVWGRSLLY